MLKIREGKVKRCRRGRKAMDKKREGGPTRWEHRKIPVTKAAQGEGPTHTVDLFRGDYAKTREDPSRGWREEP